MRTPTAILLGAFAIAALVPYAAIGQDVSAVSVPRPAQAYDAVRIRASHGGRWTAATVTGVAGDTIVLMMHGAPVGAPAVRVALDTIAAIDRRVVVPGSRAKAAAEGFYWGAIAGGIAGWLAGAGYGAVAGGTTPREGGERGVMMAAPALGVAGAITLGARHMRGDNGPESVRFEWVPIVRSAAIVRPR